MRALILLSILLSLLFLTNARKETPEEKHLRHQLSKESDLKIPHVEHEDIKSFLSGKGVKILFFGAVWCKFTQRFNPKYLAAIEQLDRELFTNAQYPWFNLKKVECSHDEAFCTNEHGTDGYPTINVYIDGDLLEEYPYADETAEFVQYVKRKIHEYKQVLADKLDSEEQMEKEMKELEEEDQKKAPLKLNPLNEVKDEADHVDKAESQTTSEVVEEPSNNHSYLLIIAGVVFIGALVGYRAYRKKAGPKYAGLRGESDF